MIKNEKYTGDLILQKTYTDDRFSRHVNRGEKNRYYVRDHHKPIVSHEDFEAANAIIEANGLEKWKDQIFRFEDIGLQSNILSTVAALQDFCKALDPDSEPVPGSSVRRLRTKLRDNYVKLHPDNYAGIYPYDAFIDDWNNENEFDM